MSVRVLKDKHEIERRLREDPCLNIYQLGDLDDFFWPDTTWFGLEEGGRLEAILLIYHGSRPATVLALAKPRDKAMGKLLASLLDRLPDTFYCHLAPFLETGLEPKYALQSHGRHLKMALLDRDNLDHIHAPYVERLTADDLVELKALYDLSYPGHWFNQRMLETGQYFGRRVGGRIVSAAGVHVYSARYRVAALGNVVTHPDHRGQGHGVAVTARLCDSLLETVEIIGLNVEADNMAAIGCYEKVGFRPYAAYYEFTAQRKPERSP